MKPPKSRIDPVPEHVPHYTGDLNAAIPGERIIEVKFDVAADKWIAVHEEGGGALTIGVGNTEILARRIAGLKAHEGRQDGRFVGKAGEKEIVTEDLVAVLQELKVQLRVSNSFRNLDASVQQRRLDEIERGLEDVRAGYKSSAVTTGLSAALAFVALKFAESAIGKLAERAMELLEAFLSLPQLF